MSEPTSDGMLGATARGVGSNEFGKERLMLREASEVAVWVKVEKKHRSSEDLKFICTEQPNGVQPRRRFAVMEQRITDKSSRNSNKGSDLSPLQQSKDLQSVCLLAKDVHNCAYLSSWERLPVL
ncbi:unnamed protein product [Pleuronectes platessa]|uniref:Uncharacterized protein n=1 Tax=Pleuronectes platessa TaxID=8262 RepID=A0A9N7VLL0_PLEPL|nr:unnamed protein product [Pleuronectes platessa]